METKATPEELLASLYTTMVCVEKNHELRTRHGVYDLQVKQVTEALSYLRDNFDLVPKK